MTHELSRCLSEQQQCAEYLRVNGDHAGARAGLADWVAEEVLLRKQTAQDSYQDFLERKSQSDEYTGFTPIDLPGFLFDFQVALTDWAIRKGKAAIFADCGLGKTPMQLVWADNVVRHTNKPVLILTPLAVGAQTVHEGTKFGIEVKRSRDGNHGGGIVVTNYEKLHLFDSSRFAGVVCDESSILKHFSGATQKAVTRFMLKVPYRLLCTATAAPNDYNELGTSSEALGELGYSDMLTRFFKQSDNKKHRMQEIKDWRAGKAEGGPNGDHFAKLSFRVHQSIGQWHLKGHAVIPFWCWVASWARACRKPSDLGFSDDRFILPPLVEKRHVITPKRPPDGMLFTFPAVGLKDERDERRRTLAERCELVARLVDHKQPAVVWCHMNMEGHALEKAIPSCIQVEGATPEDQKEEAYRAFASGQCRVLVTKPKIGAWGLNWQHCAHVITFVTHSYEQYYQAIRRCWRFGQQNPVKVDIISTLGEKRVADNMKRKAQACDVMFEQLVRHMHDGLRVKPPEYNQEVEAPPWL